MKKIILAVPALAVLLWMAWISFPASTMQAIIEDSVSGGPFTIEVKGLKKGFFYTVSLDSLTLETRRDKIVSFMDIHGTANPLQLLLLRLDLSARCHVGGGDISGHAIFTKSGIDGNLNFEKIRLGDLRFLKLAGISVNGTLDGSCSLKDAAGHIDFITRDANFEQAEFSGIRVPLEIFHTVSGALDAHGNVVHILAVSLEGKDIYAKLKGTINDSDIDMTMECMPRKLYADNPLVLAGLERYKISPGYYVIPLKGNLQKAFLTDPSRTVSAPGNL